MLARFFLLQTLPEPATKTGAPALLIDFQVISLIPTVHLNDCR